MINKVIIVGNLGNDPEIRNLENGAKVARISVATNENYQDKNGEWQTLTEWHNVVAWRRLADSAEKNLKKGSMVYVEGKITTRKWQDQNGQDRYMTEVVARLLRSLDRKESSGSGMRNNFPTAGDEFPAPKVANMAPTGNAPASNNKPPVADNDDLPF